MSTYQLQRQRDQVRLVCGARAGRFADRSPISTVFNTFRVPLILFQNTPGRARYASRECELVSLSPAARLDPDTDILQGSPRVSRLPHGSHRRTVTLTPRWKPREYGNMGLCTSALPHADGDDVGGGAGLAMPVKRLSLSSSFRSSIRVFRHRTLLFFSATSVGSSRVTSSFR